MAFSYVSRSMAWNEEEAEKLPFIWEFLEPRRSQDFEAKSAKSESRYQETDRMYRG